jgi:hypothetical protein
MRLAPRGTTLEAAGGDMSTLPKANAVDPCASTDSPSSNPAVEVDIDGALYQALIEGLLAFYEATDTFDMPYGSYTRDELVAEFRQFLRVQQERSAAQDESCTPCTTRSGRRAQARAAVAPSEAPTAEIPAICDPARRLRRGVSCD